MSIKRQIALKSRILDERTRDNVWWVLVLAADSDDWDVTVANVTTIVDGD